MDHAVSLVQTYLQLNGYFTSAEYPIIASARRNGVRTITDIDIFAFRFPCGFPVPVPKRAPQGLDTSEVDPGLGVPADSIDMIIGEVKEGRVGINMGTRDPEVLKVVVSRLGEIGTETDRVIDLCYGCRLCEIKCPYTPRDGHPFQLDFPRLMMRARSSA